MPDGRFRGTRPPTGMNAQAFGKYQLLKKLATGGMAEVWLARKTGIEGFNKLCVVKRILPHLADDPEFVQMFLNEAKIAARFNHPNIAQIDDLGETNGTYFIAMEFVHGEDLGRVMRKAWSTGQWIARPLAIRIVASACEGLFYAHTKTDDRGNPLKVVHRDISPQNILISFDGSVKLVDFGIAKAADAQSMTRSGAIKGKFAYMSPEQAAGKPLDHTSDIFAIGLVLYELLTGVRPLKRDSELATLQAALECRIEPPSRVADVPEELDPIVMTALARSADDRYRDARQFQMALEEFLVSQRWVATSAQIAELMTTLFKDRLDEEARLGYPDPVLDDGASASGTPMAPPPPGPDPSNARTGTGSGAGEMSWEAPPAQKPPKREPPSPRGGPRTLARTHRSGESNRVVQPPADVPDWEAPPAAEIPDQKRPVEARAAELPRRGTQDAPTVPARALSRDAVPMPRRTSLRSMPAPAEEEAESTGPRRTRSQGQMSRSAPRPGAAAPRRRTGELLPPPPETEDDERTLLPEDDPSAQALARRRSGQFSLGAPRRITRSGEMPEAPPREVKAEVPPARRSKKGLQAVVAPAPVRDRAARARSVQILSLVAVVAFVAVTGFLFRAEIRSFLTSTANDGAELFVSVDSNLQVDIYVQHHPDEGRAEPLVYLGRNPLRKVGGVHVRDAIIFENKPRGVRYVHEIPFGQPGEHRQVVKDFRLGSYKLRFEPQEEVKPLTLYIHGQAVGTWPGPKLDLVEGKHTLEVRGPKLRQPAQIEIEVKPGQVTESKVFNLSSLML